MFKQSPVNGGAQKGVTAERTGSPPPVLAALSGAAAAVPDPRTLPPLQGRA